MGVIGCYVVIMEVSGSCAVKCAEQTPAKIPLFSWCLDYSCHSDLLVSSVILRQSCAIDRTLKTNY